MRNKAFLSILAIIMIVTVSPRLYCGQKSPTEIVRQAYLDLLGREPDESGMRTYRSLIIDKGWSAERVRNAIKKSEEYKIHRADQIIKRAYNDLLGRDPDAAGLADYRNHIINNGWSEKKVRKNIMQSDEYKDR